MGSGAVSGDTHAARNTAITKIYTLRAMRSVSLRLDFVTIAPYYLSTHPENIYGGEDMSSVGVYIIKRILWMIPVLFVVTSVTFLLCRYGPGDPVEIRTGGRADPETVERVRQELGLNRPIPVQYAEYMIGFAQGDMGESISKYPGAPVWELIRERIWVTAQLNAASLVILF